MRDNAEVVKNDVMEGAVGGVGGVGGVVPPLFPHCFGGTGE